MGCSQSTPIKEQIMKKVDSKLDSKFIYRRKSVYFAGVTEDDEFTPKCIAKTPKQIELISKLD